MAVTLLAECDIRVTKVRLRRYFDGFSWGESNSL